MPMTTAQGEAAIEAALVEFAQERANLTFLGPADTYEANVALTAKLMADLDAAWSD